MKPNPAMEMTADYGSPQSRNPRFPIPSLK